MTEQPVENALSQGIATLWEKFKPTNLARVETLESAVAALLQGSLSAELRRTAERDAHKLAGGVGTYGYTRASQIARRCEEILAGSGPLDENHVLRLSDAVADLRTELQIPFGDQVRRGSSEASVSGHDSTRAPGTPRPVLVLAALSEEFHERVVMEAEGRGWEVHSGGSPTRRTADAVALIDLDEVPPDHREEAIHRLQLALPAVPIVALSTATDFQTRLFAARKGVHRFGRKPISPSEAVHLVGQARTVRIGTLRRVLVVDHDPQVTAAVQFHLADRGIEAHSVHSAGDFWSSLETLDPDLLIYDADLPGIRGSEACRMIRGDERWRDLPILLLASASSPDAISEWFLSGADDFISKPIAGPELKVRAENWLDRAGHLHSTGMLQLSDVVGTRVAASRSVNRLCAIGRRHDAPISLVWIRLETGDPKAVQRHLPLLDRALDTTDLVIPWSERELLVAVYDSTPEAAEGRVRTALRERQNDYRFASVPLGSEGSLDDLYRLAQRRMAGPDPERKTAGSRLAANRVDVLVIEDDEALAGLLLHALDVAGYSTEWIEDGQDAVESLVGAPATLSAGVILLDVDLPGRDGISVLRELVRNRVLDQTRVIVLTRRAGEPDVVRALELGATAYVEKPFSLPALLQRLRQAMGSG